MKCATCTFFERQRWHQTVDQRQQEQLGGKCKIIKETLELTNSSMWSMDYIHVQESFGCVLHKTGEN